MHSVIPNVTLKDSLKHAFSNKHFRIVTLGQLLENTGMAFFQACIMYYVTSLMGLAETYSVLILAISIAGSLALYPLVNKFAKRKGKKLPVILGCIVFSIAEIVICFSDKYRAISLFSLRIRAVRIIPVCRAQCAAGCYDGRYHSV